MLSKRQVMQIALALNNPALTARLIKDYQNRQAAVIAKLEEKDANPIVNFEATDSFIVWGGRKLKRRNACLSTTIYC